MSEQLLNDLRRGNEVFSNDPVYGMECRELSKNGQQPRALVLTCSDSRVVPEVIFQQPLGSMLVIRNAGARVTSDVIKDVQFFINEFKTIEVVIIMGHTQCGYYSHNVEHGIDIESVWLECLRTKLKKEQDIIDHVALKKVGDAAQIISEFIPHHITVRGAFYHMDTGVVEL